MRMPVWILGLILLCWVSGAKAKTPGPVPKEIEGRVVALELQKPTPKARMSFVTAVLETPEGRFQVRLFPEWWDIPLPFSVGDRIKVRGWIPPRAAGQRVVVAAEIENLKTGQSLVLRQGPGNPVWRRSRMRTLTVTGTIVERLIAPGIGRPEVKWLVLRVKDAQGQAYLFRISPIWLSEHPELRPGLQVRVRGFKPPYWATRKIEDYMACRVVLLETRKIIEPRRCP